MSLLDVLLFIAHSEEYGVVQAVNAYDLFLDRSPDAGGGEFWAAYILEHGFSQFAADFLGQPEAYETFFII
jgi:hypothetical protein